MKPAEMACKRSRVAGAVLFLALACPCISAQEPPRTQSNSVSELIRKLGSDRFQDRESAERALTTRDDVVGQLNRAIRTEKPEVVKRAKAILSVIDNRLLPHYLKYGKQGRIDVLVEWMGSRETVDDKICWREVNEIAFDLLKRSNIQQVRKETKWVLPTAFDSHSPSIGNRNCFPVNEADGRGWPFLKCRVRGTVPINAEKRPLGMAIIVTADSVKLGGAGSSIVFANGDVSIDIAGETIAVSDGGITTWGSRDTILVARKDIVVGKVNQDSFSQFHTGGSVRVEWILEGRRVVKPASKELLRNADVREGQNSPLGVRFFETGDIGIEAAATKNGIRVEKVSTGSSPEKAGVKVGDIIIAVDGNMSKDLEMLRRQLRRAYVMQECEMAIRRDNKDLKIVVPFFGWELPTAK